MAVSAMISASVQMTRTSTPAAIQALRLRGHAEALTGAQHRGAPQPVLGQHDEDDEQQDHRQRGAERTGPGPLVRREVGDDVVGRQAEHDGADEGAGQAAEPTEHGRGEGVDHQQGQGVGAHGRALDRGDEDAGEGGEEGAAGPGDRGQPLRAAAVELQQVGVVDHGPHGHARAGAPEQEAAMPQAMTMAMIKAMISCQVMFDPEDRDLGVGAEELVEEARRAGRRVPDPDRQGQEAEHHAHGHDDLGDLRGAPEVLHDDLVHHRAQRRAPGCRAPR